MQCLKMVKGDLLIKDNDFSLINDADKLAQEIENLLYSDTRSIFWNNKRGLDRSIIFYGTVQQIKSEVENKILQFFKSEVLSVLNIEIKKQEKIKVTARISTIYKEILISGEI